MVEAARRHRDPEAHHLAPDLDQAIPWRSLAEGGGGAVMPLRQVSCLRSERGHRMRRMEAALDVGCYFVGVILREKLRFLHPPPEPRITNLYQLQRIVATLHAKDPKENNTH